MIKLYTQNGCYYCGIMMNKLNEWGIRYDVINISENSEGKTYLKEQGCITVPQLFLDNFNINENIQTLDLTEEMFYSRLDDFLAEVPSDVVAELIKK